MIANYLYVYNAEGLETINIRGVFENPQDVSKFDECENGGCYDDSRDPFPIPMAGSFSDTENDRMQDPRTIRAAAPKKPVQ